MSKKQKSGLKIALPNGSLEEGTLRLFDEAGLKIRKNPRTHAATVESPLMSSVTFMRPQHIPSLVARGVYDAGICGLDWVEESGCSPYTHVITKLRYGRGASKGEAKVVLVTSEENSVSHARSIEEDAVLLSEYPRITEKILALLRLTCEIQFSYGSTEAHIPKDYPYGVCLTDTGESLVANRLKVISEVMETHTVLITSKEIWSRNYELELPEPPQLQSLLMLHRLLCGALGAREKVLLKMNVSSEKKDTVLAILPALKTPTVALLADGKSFAIETVVPKEDTNALIIKAAKAGAEGILELPITKLIPNW